MINISLVLFILILGVNGIDESLEIYSKFNDFITIIKDQRFIIETTEESIAYFDSIDRGSEIYISKEYNKVISDKEERITGKFYKIKPNIKYYVTNKLYLNQPSVFKRYLYPLNLGKEDFINYFYLEKDKSITIDFQKNSEKTMISLSRKTLNSKVTIIINNENYELNQNNLYYKIPDGFNGKIKLEIRQNDAFIEFLTGINDYEDFEILSTELTNYEIKSRISIIRIPYTQKDIKIKLTSDMPFKFSFSNGFSNDEKYYYHSNSNIDINCSKKDNKYINSIIIHGLYKDITLSQNEKFSFTINIEKKSDQIIYLDYNHFSQIDILLNYVIKDNACADIIKNIQDLLEIYVFSDIAKNPPKINGLAYHHEKINLKEELGKISTTNRYFYEFYQDIEKILGTVKDLHLNIINFFTDTAVLPFNFVIKEYNNNFRIFIEKNKYYNKFDDKIKQFIDNHLNIPLKSINNKDPFDYIQNWSKFNSAKNQHAEFTNIISKISGFNLFQYPQNYSDLSLNDYEFEDNGLIKIEYLFNPTIKKSSFSFDNYLINNLQSNGPKMKIPLIDKIYENFLIFKGEKKVFLSEVKAKTIQWDLSYIEGTAPDYKCLKCRVDKDNKVNVVYQNSFHLTRIYEVIGIMLKCVKLFYTNDYPIIIIESKNGGGYDLLYTIFQQILQPKIENRVYLSYKVTSISQQYFNSQPFNNIDMSNCDELSSFNDFSYYYDDSYGDNSINHKRTPPVDSVYFIWRQALNEFRKEIINSPNFKKPTDIIIFTDSFSFSATSDFIKGFQNTGGAIIVGYYGNPKIEGTQLFDASQSPSRVEGKDSLQNTQMYNELIKYGFYALGVTSGETYNFHQANTKDQIPREYQLDPVDFRVNIYSDYSDEIYDKFIEEGLKIHEKLNINNECNSNNEKLLLHDDNCKNINGYAHAHGGYKCGNNNIWEKSVCEPYYCDMGYYFDQYQKKCIESCRFDKTRSYFIYEDNYNKVFNIIKDITYYFIFTKNANNCQFFYSYTLNGALKRFPVNGNILTINGYKKLQNNIYLTIESKITNNIKLYNLRGKTSKFSFVDSKETILFIENQEDFNLYIDNIYKSSKTEVKLAQYKSEMTLDDILNHNDNYFSSYTDNIHSFQKDEIFILYFKFSELDPFNIFINPINIEETIEIYDNEIDFLYLEKEKEYILDFKTNSINRILKLSRETLNSEIIIENENIILNSGNLYYQLEDNFKGKIILKINKADALIEFLFKQTDSELDILSFTKKEFKLEKKYNVLAIPEEYNSKIINIELIKNEKIINSTIYLGYSIPPYNYFSIDIEENKFQFFEKFDFDINEHYKGNINLMKNEYYCVMIEIFSKDVIMNIKIEDENKNEKENKKLKSWEIALIVIASIIVFLLLVLLLCIMIRHACS